MDDTTTIDAPVDEASTDTDTSTDAVDPIDEELLIEEVSIDGMCGVY
jgi:mycofactocin precursor